jgi:hypothetical protein
MPSLVVGGAGVNSLSSTVVGSTTPSSSSQAVHGDWFDPVNQAPTAT